VQVDVLNREQFNFCVHSTGYIGSGRQNWDGSGGTGAALNHFEATGSKYPLCVKLGTITAEGKGDVYSYDPSEDCMVKDPLLGQHLSHFGIDILNLKKTEKTMLEVEIELNQDAAVFSQVLEENEKLVECYGKGCLGLLNLGNSCYVNSVLQVLLSLPEFRNRFCFDSTTQRSEAYLHSPPEPQTDLNIQFIKLAAAIANPAQSHVTEDEDEVLSVSPNRIRDVLGKGHSDFSGREQQDAKEYLAHVLDKISRMDHGRPGNDSDPAKLFTFNMEEKIVCKQSDKVRYSTSVHAMLGVKIPDFESKPNDEVPCFSLEECLKLSLGQTEVVEDYLSPATGARGMALKTQAMETFPKYLALEIKRYVVGDNWVPKKLDCKVDVPRQLDITQYHGKGPLPGESLLPEPSDAAEIEPDEMLLSQLMSMGFHENGCKRALVAVKNVGADEAMQWVLQHMDDPDFNSPLSSSSAVDEEAVAMLSSMGFASEACIKALSKCDGHLERAADWLFSHASELEATEKPPPSTGRYTLKGFISHLGKSTTGGHYLCHINSSPDIKSKSLDRWVLYNDRKVALSRKPPLQHGYLYIFQRDDSV